MTGIEHDRLTSGESKPEDKLFDRAIRPKRLDEYVGQKHLVGPGKPLRQASERGQLHSMILWGPPGTGKTTLALILARSVDAEFITLSAVLSGVKDIRAAVDQAKARLGQGRRTVLFVDEVHRFNKAQQDAFLPHVEEGTVIFIGATTENPSFELNNALLSRARVYRLRGLERADLDGLLNRALAEPELADTVIEDDARDLLLGYADGDARRLLNMLEIALDLTDGEQPRIDRPLMEEVLRDAVPGSAALVPMDGFHRPHAELVTNQLAEQKGTPHTFDPAGFVGALERLKQAAGDVSLPSYSREIEDVVPDAISIAQNVPIVVVEGNYLLLRTGDWAKVRQLLDHAAFLDVPRELVRARLLRRHAEHGLFTQERNRHHIETVDLANLDLVEQSKARADLIIRMVTDG